MTKPLALAFLTKDRVELSKRTLAPLLDDSIDLWWIDGSKTVGGQNFPIREYEDGWNRLRRDYWKIRANVTGGADAAIVYALTTLLNETTSPYIGLCENDVLLPHGWTGPTLGLFQRGNDDGLHVGAVSARAFADRILCQRDGYALMHNLGAGHVVFTRGAAKLILKHYRTGWSTDNRRVFHQLSGQDIGKYWAFRGNPHAITADWTFDRILASQGLASLALTPSDVEMLGQEPPLSEQGLALVREPVELLRNVEAFSQFVKVSGAICHGLRRFPDPLFLQLDDGAQMVFAHQIGALGGVREGFWQLRWAQGFGPFSYMAEQVEPSCETAVEATVAGACEIFVSGGEKGGRVRVVDLQSGYVMEPELPPEGTERKVMQLAVPGGVACRTVRLIALDPGVIFYGIVVHEPQIVDPTWTFDHSGLPKP